jgi:hypothetical protein
MYKRYPLKHFGAFIIFIDRAMIEFQKQWLINCGNTNLRPGRKAHALLNAHVISALCSFVSGETASQCLHLCQTVLVLTTLLIFLQYSNTSNGSLSLPSLNLWSTMEGAPSSHAWPTISSILARKSSLGIGLSAKQSMLVVGPC